MTRASADRVKAVWTGTGTGTMSLGGAAPGEPVQAFPAVLNGQAISYLIKHETAMEAEAGIGIYTHVGATLTRLYRTYPTLGGSAVNFSSGTKLVSVTAGHIALAANVAAVDPGTGDNITTGFLQGHMWINTTNNSAWILINHVAPAVWARIDAHATGGVGISGAIVAGDFPQFVDSTDVTGITALELVNLIDSLFPGAIADYRGEGEEELSSAFAAKANSSAIPTGQLASKNDADLPATIAVFRPGFGSERMDAAFAAVAGLGTLSATDDAGGTVGIGSLTSGTLRYLLSNSAVNVQLQATAPVGTRVVVVKAGTGVVTVSCLAGAGYFVAGDNHGGTKSTTSFTVAGWAEFRCRTNGTGTAATFVVDGVGLSLPTVITGSVDFTSAGIRVPNGAAVSGTLTVAAHGGGEYKTSGNCTITPAAGFNVTLLATGAHTVGAGGATQTLAAGDAVTVACFSAANGDVKMFKTVAANVINLPTA